jgi:phosphoglucosamine mutase
MAKLVREYRADIGIALDGDADRLVICDEKGVVVDGDQIMAIVAIAFAKAGKLKAGGVVATVMSNLGLERALKDQGLTLERTGVGDRYVMARMREGGFNVGGEQSGHVILSDFSTTGDGLIAALQVLAVMIQHQPADERWPSVRARAAAAGKRPLRRRQAAGERQVGQGRHRRRRGPAERLKGRIVVRPSGTLIRIMAEGDDQEGGQVDRLGGDPHHGRGRRSPACRRRLDPDRPAAWSRRWSSRSSRR